jgi:hypothetical protein
VAISGDQWHSMATRGRPVAIACSRLGLIQRMNDAREACRSVRSELRSLTKRLPTEEKDAVFFACHVWQVMWAVFRRLPLLLLLRLLLLGRSSSPSGPRDQWQSVAISSNQWQAVAIGGNRWQSVAISGSRWQSVAIGGNQWQSVAIGGSRWQSVAVGGNRWQAVASGGKRWQSVAIGGNRWQSVAISGKRW